MQANQSAEQAYDQYIGHFGAKNVKPPYIGEISSKYYDGTSDDLLTGGLGTTACSGRPARLGKPRAPSAAELRRLAIHNNYRAIVDTTANGGYGLLYGPTITPA